jgi:hypothetical protein
MTKQEVDQTIQEAFQIWAEVTPIKFTRISDPKGTVDIEISFSSFWHGDEFPFDGMGGTLAHAYFPEYGGDVHLDSHEVWTFRSTLGKLIDVHAILDRNWLLPEIVYCHMLCSDYYVMPNCLLKTSIENTRFFNFLLLYQRQYICFI